MRVSARDIRAYDRTIIEQFRGEGEMQDGFDREQLILLTTTGARSGQAHTTPLVFYPDGDRLLVVAAAAGAPRNPAWYVNLLADDTVTVESAEGTYAARAHPLEGAEYDKVWSSLKEGRLFLAEYEAAAHRRLPVVALVRVMPGAGG